MNIARREHSYVSSLQLTEIMQVSVTFPNMMLPAVVVTTGCDSLVHEVLTAAAEEWDINPEEVELSFSGDILPGETSLVSHGVDPMSELEVFKIRCRIISKSCLTNYKMIEQIKDWYHHNYECLYLDSQTFIENGILEMEESLLPSDIRRVSFRNSDSKLRIIGANFNSYGSSVTSIDFSKLTSVTGTQTGFLSSCSSLTELDLSGFCNVTSIGNHFLNSCRRLTKVDLTGFHCLTRIGSCFLSGPRSLTAINLPSLPCVAVGELFLNSSSCATIDFSNCNLSTLGSRFLMSCLSVANLNLSGLRNVTEIYHTFLYNCGSLTSLDLSSLSSVTSIDANFLLDCSSITHLNLSGFSRVTTIGDKFLKNCSSLTVIDLSMLSSVTVIGFGFLSDCRSLIRLDLINLCNLCHVHSSFLENCTSLTSVDLST